jgi:hypothetical protein
LNGTELRDVAVLENSANAGAVYAHAARLLRFELVLGVLVAGAAGGSSGCQAAPGANPGKRPSAPGTALIPDAEGRVDAATTGKTAIHGRWLAASDAADCQSTGQPSDACSTLVTQAAGAPELRPTADLGMCVAGVTAQVAAAADGNPDWNHIWGAKISLTLNDGEPYDALAHGVTGFAFHLDSEPVVQVGLRVELPSPAGGGAAAWGDAGWGGSPVHAGRNEFRWADVGRTNYPDSPPPFDPSQLIALDFRVPSRRIAPSSFAFCIRQLSALTD